MDYGNSLFVRAYNKSLGATLPPCEMFSILYCVRELDTKARSTIDTLAKTLSDMKSTNLDMERGSSLEDCLSELLDAVAQKMNQ
jgi:hypothetical protein